MSIKNNKVFIAAGMYCGTDDSDLLVPEVYESREDARKAIIEAIIGAACAAELLDAGMHITRDSVVVTIQGMVDGENVLDDSLTILSFDVIDKVAPADLRRITLKDNDYDEYWTWEIHEKVIG